MVCLQKQCLFVVLLSFMLLLGVNGAPKIHASQNGGRTHSEPDNQHESPIMPEDQEEYPMSEDQQESPIMPDDMHILADDEQVQPDKPIQEVTTYSPDGDMNVMAGAGDMQVEETTIIKEDNDNAMEQRRRYRWHPIHSHRYFQNCLKKYVTICNGKRGNHGCRKKYVFHCFYPEKIKGCYTYRCDYTVCKVKRIWWKCIRKCYRRKRTCYRCYRKH